ncbi:MAG: DNA repair protein RecN [Pedosphaera sp.]|nr:DNA repair protein RecN [Pedosphaera sp.]
MLTTLRIKNLALVPDLTLELPPGLTVITGETGAGKSVILGALQLLLGQRADRTLIRAGTEGCSVEAVFEAGRLRMPWREFLEENGLEPSDAGQLILKRSFTATGVNRQFINGSPTNLTTLASLGAWLVDLHGPHDHQSLLQPARQLEILDAFGGLEAKREMFVDWTRRRSRVTAEKGTLVVDEATYARQLDLVRFQVREIVEAKLRADEEAEIGSEHLRTSNAARLLELSQAARNALSEGEETVLTAFGIVGRALQDLARIDPGAQALVEKHETAREILRELQAELSRYTDRVELDPDRLEILEQRLNLIHSLKRKYGADLAEVIAFGEAAQARLTTLESRDAELERLNAELAMIEGGLKKAGQELSAARKKLLPRLSTAVGRELAALGFRQSSFEVMMTSAQSLTDPAVSASGFDRVEFQFAPNPGEPGRPLRSIASSGELARVMLALKTVLAKEDDVPVLVFDEVDANVGGETATTVGEKMRQIAQDHQVLCITHLAPVAAAGGNHLLVVKDLIDGRTESRIILLDRRGRVAELARMLGGGGDAARRHAEALLERKS